MPVQVDMAMSVKGRLGKIVAEESARAAELFLRLSRSPRGLSNLSAYRQASIKARSRFSASAASGMSAKRSAT
jgi:hypothetical protein